MNKYVAILTIILVFTGCHRGYQFENVGTTAAVPVVEKPVAQKPSAQKSAPSKTQVEKQVARAEEEMAQKQGKEEKRVIFVEEEIIKEKNGASVKEEKRVVYVEEQIAKKKSEEHIVVAEKLIDEDMGTQDSDWVDIPVENVSEQPTNIPSDNIPQKRVPYYLTPEYQDNVRNHRHQPSSQFESRRKSTDRVIRRMRRIRHSY